MVMHLKVLYVLYLETSVDPNQAPAMVGFPLPKPGLRQSNVCFIGTNTLIATTLISPTGQLEYGERQQKLRKHQRAVIRGEHGLLYPKLPIDGRSKSVNNTRGLSAHPSGCRYHCSLY